MNEFLSDPSNLWVFIGIILIIIEVSVIPGIGFLFAGLGALTLAGLLLVDMANIEGALEHIAYFFFFTTVWAVILWRPLKNAIKNKNGEKYENFAGTTAVTVKPFTVGSISEVKWNGTTMKARIDSSSETSEIDAGVKVWVHGKDSGILLIDVSEPAS